MTSLEIAELTGKQHKDVLKAIRNMEPAWVKVNGLKFQLVEYRDHKIGDGSLTSRVWRCNPLIYAMERLV